VTISKLKTVCKQKKNTIHWFDSFANPTSSKPPTTYEINPAT